MNTLRGFQIHLTRNRNQIYKWSTISTGKNLLSAQVMPQLTCYWELHPCPRPALLLLPPPAVSTIYWEISSSNWWHSGKMSLTDKADALLLIAALNCLLFIFPPQLKSCVGTKSNSWFPFCQLPERWDHSPWCGIRQSSTRPSRKHGRCAVVLGKNHPRTIRKKPLS